MNKNMPIRALYEIRAFSKPMTRPDWRTCKRRETRLILIRKCLKILKLRHVIYTELWPNVDNKWDKEDAEKANCLLAAYEDVTIAFAIDTPIANMADYLAAGHTLQEYRAACDEWLKGSLEHKRSILRLMKCLVGTTECVRVLNYDRTE